MSFWINWLKSNILLILPVSLYLPKKYINMGGRVFDYIHVVGIPLLWPMNGIKGVILPIKRYSESAVESEL